MIGPDGLFYITDRHHLTRSIFEADIPTKKKRVYTKVGKDFRNKTFTSFYKYMKENNFVYLKKTGENFRNIENLPKHISMLSDDRFRSLAWIIREQKGYEKVNVLFLEFIWADFLYKMGIRIKRDRISEEIIRKSLRLVHSKQASHLPGYIAIAHAIKR